MALINQIYVFVETEEVKRDTQISDHPVEEGIDLTDQVKRSPLLLCLSGEIVGDNYENQVFSLEQMQKKGELVEYIGVNRLSRALITSFSTEHSGKIRGGCSFSMEIREIRIAASAFAAGLGNTGNQQVEENAAGDAAAEETPARTYMVQSGDTLWRLAKAYYGSGAKFPVIFEANRDKLSDPNVIQVGQVLVIP